MPEARDNYHTMKESGPERGKCSVKTALWTLEVFNKYFCLLIYNNNPPIVD